MNDFLISVRKQFEYYKLLGEKSFDQLTEDQLNKIIAPGSNSISTIVQHLSGNMLSRWTDFLTSDGEKPWRERDTEFEQEYRSKKQIIEMWDAGWECLFNTLNELKEEDLNKVVFIRNQGHTVMEAINRQLAHYPYHIGQIVYIGKFCRGEDWQSLSIPKGQSKVHNIQKFKSPKSITHFTDEYLDNTHTKP